MRVHIDETGRHDQAPGIDHAFTQCFGYSPDDGDFITADPDIGHETRISGPVHNRAGFDHDIVSLIRSIGK